MFWNKLVIAVELTREVVVATPAHVHVLFQVVAPPDLDRVLISNAKRTDSTLSAVSECQKAGDHELLRVQQLRLSLLGFDEVSQS